MLRIGFKIRLHAENQGGILTVILASRMTGNPQFSGEISCQNHAPYLSPMGSGQNHALFMSRMGFIGSVNKLKHKEDVISCQRKQFPAK